MTARIAHLRADREARLELAARALAGSLAGLGPLVDQVADDAAHEAIDAAADRRIAATYHDRALAAVREAVSRGTFLREEALRHWQDYVGADDITRIFSKGIGAVRGAIASIFRPSRAPIAEVREATTDDLVAVARLHAAEAARRTASAWSEDRSVADAVAADPTLWGPSAGFDDRLRARLDEWIASIGTDIAETGEGKRRLARGASIGVNAVGVGVMLATFIHTAGLTGTEVGVAAATAFLNQKLLGALFGEAAMVELIARARRRLDEALVETFAEERRRFDALAPSPEDLEALAADLREAADEIRRLPAVVPMDALALFDRRRPDRPSGGRPTPARPGAMSVAEPLTPAAEPAADPRRERSARAAGLGGPSIGDQGIGRLPPAPRRGHRRRRHARRPDRRRRADRARGRRAARVPGRDLRARPGRRDGRREVEPAQRARRVVGQRRLGAPTDDGPSARLGARDRAAPTWAASSAGSASPDRRFATTAATRSATWRSSTCRTSIRSSGRIASGSRRSCRASMRSSGSPIPRSTTTRSSTTISSPTGCRAWIARSWCSTRPTGSRPTTRNASGATSSVTWARIAARGGRAKPVRRPADLDADDRRDRRSSHCANGSRPRSRPSGWSARTSSTAIAAAVTGLARAAGVDPTARAQPLVDGGVAAATSDRVTAEMLRVVDLPAAERQAVAATRARARARGAGPLGGITSRIYRWSGRQARVADPGAFLARWRERGSLAPALEVLRERGRAPLREAPPAARATLATSMEPAALGTNLARAVDRAIAARASVAPTSRIWTLIGLLQTLATLALVFSAVWVVLWVFVRFPVDSVTVPVLGQLPIPFVVLVASLLAGYLIARMLGAHAGWLGRRWARVLAHDVRERVGREVETSALAGLDRLEGARRALWNAARGAGEDCVPRRR